MIKVMLANEHHVWNISVDDEAKSKLQSAMHGSETGPIMVKNHDMPGHCVIFAEHVLMFVFVPEKYWQKQKKKAENKQKRGRGSGVIPAAVSPEQEKHLRGRGG